MADSLEEDVKTSPIWSTTLDRSPVDRSREANILSSSCQTTLAVKEQCLSSPGKNLHPSSSDDHCPVSVLSPIKSPLPANAPSVSFSSPPSAAAVSPTAASMSLVASTLPNFLRVPMRDTTLPDSRSISDSTSTSSSKSLRNPTPGKTSATSKSEDDIKIYVETTMNELLGWYGLPKMDNGDTPQLSIGDYAASLPQKSPGRPTCVAVGPVSAASASLTATPPSLNVKRRRDGAMQAQTSPNCLDSKLGSDTNNNSSSCGADDEDEDDDDEEDDDNDNDIEDLPDGPVRAAGTLGRDTENFPVTTSEATGLVSPGLSGGEVPDNERNLIIACSWCRQTGHKLFALESPEGTKSFCSEICFTQCRRASFKRNKVCEWCKHVRHTLNFVDFQDGDLQLQFCSEKCLNQYKMNIFCTEARQHLQHLESLTNEERSPSWSNGKGKNAEKEILITPELWLSSRGRHTAAVKTEVVEGVEEEAAVDLGKGVDGNGRKHLEDGLGYLEASSAKDWRGEVKPGCPAHVKTSNEEYMETKLSTNRHRKDRHATLVGNPAGKKISDNGHLHDKRGIRKSVPGSKIGIDVPCTSSVQEKGPDARLNRSPQVQAPFPSNMTGLPFNPQQMSAFSMLPNWASSQLFSMIPSHLNPAFTPAGFNSGLGGLNYASNSLLYSSLFGGSPLAAASTSAPKETVAALGLSTVKSEARRGSARCGDRSDLVDRRDGRADSSEPSARSSSSYSSSDTPGTPSTPGLSIALETAGSSFPHHQTQSVHKNESNSHLLPPPCFNDPTMLPFALGLHQGNRGTTTAVSSNPPQQPPNTPQTASETTAQQQRGLLPPITVLVPYPVAVPIPIPIPIPLPIAPEKLQAFFQEKLAQKKSSTSPPSTTNRPTDPRPKPSSTTSRPRPSSVNLASNISPLVSPQLSSTASSSGLYPCGSSSLSLNGQDSVLVVPGGRASVDSIRALRREPIAPQTPTPVSPYLSPSLKRPKVSLPLATSDYSKRSRHELTFVGSEDEAIDLSKLSSRSSSPRIPGHFSEKENMVLVKQSSLSDSDRTNSPQTADPSLPRIHIVSDQPDLPLCPSSLESSISSPSHQSHYSDRRSRILDAPSIPKRIRSPSPERRYVRTVPRDMVEAARRRGLRARVRTK